MRGTLTDGTPAHGEGGSGGGGGGGGGGGNSGDSGGGGGNNGDSGGRPVGGGHVGVAPVSSPEQISPQAHAALQEAFLTELESRALLEASSQSKGPGHVTTYDDNVRLLQISLNQVMGRQIINPDGKWGPKTREAVSQFQELYGMPLGGDLAEQMKTVSMVLRAVAAEEGQ